MCYINKLFVFVFVNEMQKEFISMSHIYALAQNQSQTQSLNNSLSYIFH